MPQEPEAFCAELGLDLAEFTDALEQCKKLLYEEREKREHPFRDDKVLASWNGLMLKSFAEAGAALNRPDYIEAARRNAQFGKPGYDLKKAMRERLLEIDGVDGY